METRPARTWLCAALTVALAVVGGACGDTSDETTGTTRPGASATVAPTSVAGKTLAVTGIDYAFTGVPKTVAAGTVVLFKNTSAKEVHELIALRVKDGDTRPMADLLALPEAERDAAAEFRGVAVAFPGEDGFTPEGPVTLAQPGRYLFVCAIPTGADPAAYREAAKNPGPPPSIAGGPPHVAKGMVAELTVT